MPETKRAEEEIRIRKSNLYRQTIMIYKTYLPQLAALPLAANFHSPDFQKALSCERRFRRWPTKYGADRIESRCRLLHCFPGSFLKFLF